MTKVIIVKNDDGTCHIVRPVPNMLDNSSRDRLELAEQDRLSLEASEEEVMDFIISRSNLAGKNYRVDDESVIPSDRSFRDAWTDSNPTKTVDVDIDKAKEIHKNNLRIMRKPKLEALDIELLKALELGLDTKEIAKKKQILRDITKLPLPNTVEALKASIPSCLKDEA